MGDARQILCPQSLVLSCRRHLENLPQELEAENRGTKELWHLLGLAWSAALRFT